MTARRVGAGSLRDRGSTKSMRGLEGELEGELEPEYRGTREMTGWDDVWRRGFEG